MFRRGGGENESCRFVESTANESILGEGYLNLKKVTAGAIWKLWVVSQAILLYICEKRGTGGGEEECAHVKLQGTTSSNLV